MTLAPLLIATLCYVWAGVALVLDSKYALGVTYGSYAIANLGLIAIAIK